MVTNFEDIVERLAQRKEFEINLKDVLNETDLEKAIKNSFTQDSKRDTLVRNKDDLFDTANVKDSVKDNAVELLGKAKSLQELDAVFDNLSANISKIGKTNEDTIRNFQVEKENELRKEKIPSQITKEDILSSPRNRISKFAEDFGITEEEARQVLIDAGATVKENTFSRTTIVK